MSYTIIENFLPPSIQDTLEQIFQYDTKWNYVSVTTGIEGVDFDKDLPIKECPQLIHTSVFNAELSDSFGLTRLVLNFLESATGCKIGDIHKIKTNMNLKDPSFKDIYHPPHMDHKSTEYFTLIYYIKDSDGPTRIFNKSATDAQPYNNLKVIGEVHPKKGTALLIKSNRLHTGTCPIESENRLVINYVFKAENLSLDIKTPTPPTIRYIA